MMQEDQTVVQIRIDARLQHKLDDALEMLKKRSPELEWNRDQLIRLAIKQGLAQLFRQYVRKKTHLSGTVWKLTPDDPSRQEIVIQNISLSGIGFTLNDFKQVKKDEILELELTLDDPEQTALKNRVVVMYAEGRQIGAKFCNRPKHFQKKLKDYLEKEARSKPSDRHLPSN